MVDTLENPVEYRFPGVRQRQIEPGVPGRDYPDQMRSLLRQNPNAIVVGEMRDSVTAQLGLEAANTGHLVCSTLHANSALATVPRLIELGVEGPVIAIAARLFVAQRLVAKLCPTCSRKHPSHQSLCVQHATLWKTAQTLEVLPREVTEMNFREAGGGCDLCRGRGIIGRIAVYELREVTDFLRRRIAREGANFDLHAAEEDFRNWTEDQNEAVRAAQASYLKAQRPDQAPHSLELAKEGLAQAKAKHARDYFAARSLLDDGILKAAMGHVAIEEVFARVSQRVM
jgi:type II secretory ATPase GspE/PulE/Tfp pilus assembly ATPase PilB-like protein